MTRSPGSLHTSLSHKPDFSIEQALWAQNLVHICGVDEAGRGPLAGPVVAAAVILSPDAAIEGLDDSKKLSARKREALFGMVMERALSVCVASVSATSIDASDIRKASLTAMARAVRGLAIAPHALLFDGRDIPVGLPPRMHAQAVVKGDQRSQSIAAAAIIAKVTRDRMMTHLDGIDPDYCLGTHMGYGSQRHRDVIGAKGGIARVHRFTFRPLRRD